MTLHLDATHRFCIDETPQICARIRTDLERVSEILLEEVPGASIVLTGSLAHGEGRLQSDRRGLKSDYDLYLVTPGLTQTLRVLGSRGACVSKLLSLDLLTDLEVVVIWGSLVRRGLTYVPGLLLGGSAITRSLLEYSRFPGDRTLCQAYAALLRAIHTDSDQELLAKAVTLGFRTWLMGRTTGDNPLHNEELLSLRGNLAYIRKRPSNLQRQWSEMIELALLVGLGESISRPKIDPKMVLAFLQWVRGIIRFSPVRWASLHYVVLQVRYGRSFIGPHRFLSKYVTLAHSLAEACLWNEGVPIHSDIMRGIEDLVGAPCPSRGSPDHEARIINEMIALARVHTCRIVVPRGRSAVGTRSHS